MQISLPAVSPALSDPSAAAPGNPFAAIATLNPSADPTGSFESLLPQAVNSAKPAAAGPADGAEAEQVAAAVAMVLWMPVAPAVSETKTASAVENQNTAGGVAAGSNGPALSIVAKTDAAVSSPAGSSLFAPVPSAGLGVPTSGTAKMGAQDKKNFVAREPAQTLDQNLAQAPIAASTDLTNPSPSQRTSEAAPAVVTGDPIAPVAGQDVPASGIISFRSNPKISARVAIESTPAAKQTTDSRSFSTAAPAQNGSEMVPLADSAARVAPAIPGAEIPFGPEAKSPAAAIAQAVAVLPTIASTTAPQNEKTAVREKIAAAPSIGEETSSLLRPSREKEFVVTAQKTVTSTGASVGISVAKVPAVMSSANFSRSKSSPVSEAAPVVSTLMSASPATAVNHDTPITDPAPTTSVHEAIAAVASAVESLERRIDASQKTVDLQFHVGDQHLALRLELRDGTVHTTFRTDSADLRAALTEEWHATVPPVTGTSVRVAEPVFSAAPTPVAESGFSSLSQGSSQQRQPPASESPFTLPRAAQRSTMVVADAPTLATVLPLRSTQLLHAFA